MKRIAVTVLYGTGTGSYEFGKEATVKANEKEGYSFIHWEDAKGNVVSTESTFKFTVSNDVSLTAIYKENFKIPTSIDDIKNSFNSFVQSAGKTKSAEYKYADVKYSSKYYSYKDEMNLTFYQNGFYGNGNYYSDSKAYPFMIESHIENGKLQKIRKYDGENHYSSTSSASGETIGKNNLSSTIANDYINNYGLVETLKEVTTVDILKNIDTFEVKDENDVCKIKIVGHATTSTMYNKIDIDLEYDHDFFISKFVANKTQYVMANECVDGVLKEDAKAKDDGYYLYSYTCEKLSSEKEVFPNEHDTREKYLISDFQTKGRYYEGSTQRYFTEENPCIWKGARIQANYIEVVSGSIEPSTSIEKNTLSVVSSSNENIIEIERNDKGDASYVVAKGVGKASLVIETTTGFQKTIQFEVKEYLPPISMKIDSADSVAKNEEIVLGIKDLTPSTSDSNVSWSVDDSSIGIIETRDGVTYLKGLKNGYVNVTATSASDSQIKASKKIYVSNGAMTQEQLSSYVVGTWNYVNGSSSFTFIFNEDGTFQTIDAYRSGNKIDCTGKYQVTNKMESEFDHFGTYYNAEDYQSGYVVIEISDVVLSKDGKAADSLDIHFALATDGRDMHAHFRVNDTGSTFIYSATKI